MSHSHIMMPGVALVSIGVLRTQWRIGSRVTADYRSNGKLRLCMKCMVCGYSYEVIS